jgi:hypothetical protein
MGGRDGGDHKSRESARSLLSTDGVDISRGSDRSIAIDPRRRFALTGRERGDGEREVGGVGEQDR